MYWQRSHLFHTTYHANIEGIAINVGSYGLWWNVYRDGVKLAEGRGRTLAEARLQAELAGAQMLLPFC